MSEIGGRLARELRDFYTRIEGRRLPASLVDLDVNAIKRVRRAKGRLKTIAGLAAVAAAAGAFLVIGLATHLASTNRTPGAGATGSVLTSPTPSATSSPTVSATPSASAPAGPTAGWPLLSSTAGGFSFRYPAGWRVDGPCVTTSSEDPMSPIQQGPMVEVRVGPSATSSCGTEVFQGVIVDSYVAAGPPLGPPGVCQVQTFQAVTIGGVSGHRIANSPDPTRSSCASVVRSIFYSFQVGQHIFAVSYYQNAGDPELTSDIDTIMTQTWSFQPAA